MTAVTYTVTDGIAHVELNRPDAANALNLDLAHGLQSAADQIAADDSVRAVVLSGAGKRFCAGGDIGAFADAEDTTAALHELAVVSDKAVASFEALEKPVAVAVHGAVAGAGLGIMLSGDVVIAAEGTKFVVAYPGIGLNPDCGTSTLLPLAMGRQRALAFALGGAPLLADAAREQGLVAEVVADPLARAQELAAMWVAGAAGAYGQTRRLLRAGSLRSREESGVDEAETIRRRASEPETKALFDKFLGR